jgi:hypothetical protein
VQDEQYPKRAGKLTYVHNVKFLRNAGDLPSVQTGHHRGAERQEKKRKEISVKETPKTRCSYNAGDTQGFRKIITFSFFLNLF